MPTPLDPGDDARSGPASPVEPASPDPRLAPAPGRPCRSHPARTTETACGRCGAWVCAECRVLARGRVLCARCVGVEGVRAPLLLRLALLAALLLALQAVAHRVLSHDLDLAVAATWPPWLRSVLDADAVLSRWAWAGAAGVIAISMGYARSDSGTALFVSWRVLLAVVLAGGSLVLHSDALFALVARGL